MNNFHWEVAVPEDHHAANFDVRKVGCGPVVPGGALCCAAAVASLWAACAVCHAR